MIMSDSRRAARVGAALRSALGELFLHGLRDPSLAQAGLISVTGVKVSGDIGVATVYVVGTSKEPEAVAAMLKGLERAAPFLRAEAASRLSLRRAPELRFRLDESIEEGRHIESILEELSTGGDNP